PVLRVNGQLYPAVPMPYRLTNWLPVLRWLRFPDRFNVFLALPLAVLAAYGARAVLASLQRRGRWAKAIVPCLLGGVIVFEYLIVPAPLQAPPSSPFYAQLAVEAGDFAVLNLPINSQQSKRYMAAQAAHHRPILQGKTARLSDEVYAYLDANPWLRGLRQSNEMLPEFNDVSARLAALAEDGVRYVILHKTLVDGDRAARWQRYLLAAPRFEDEQIAVYSTAPLAGRDFALAAELLPGTGVIRAVASTACLNPGRVLGLNVGWDAVAAPGQDMDVELALVSSKGATVQAETFPGWSAAGMAWGYYELRASPTLPGGDYAIRLALLDPATGALQGQAATVGQVQVSGACTFDVPPDATGANVLFGDDARLPGYRLRRDGDELTLTLHWRAERRMETNYKIFVHVFDPATGIPVVQDDAMPRRNTFPTTFWWPGEVVVDVIPISLAGVPAGAYGVAVGVY
ncbi:MAG: hypothetical protein GY831_30330, partial [Delftia sp.]|nr:hypothetical protein [Delftia sp.]